MNLQEPVTMLLKESTRYMLQRLQRNPDILISPEDLGERDYLVICMDGDSTLLTSDWLQRSQAKSSPPLTFPSTTRPPASAVKRIRFSSEDAPSYVTDPPFMCLLPLPGRELIDSSLSRCLPRGPVSDCSRALEAPAGWE